MFFQTHNDKRIRQAQPINCIGTHFQGHLTLNYNDIKKVFGKPLGGDGYKVDAKWEIEFADGVVATIYNYKDGKNYNGASGLPKTKITDWHIGGHDERAVRNVIKAMGRKI